MNYVSGYTQNGEILHFERWVYERYMHGTLGDPDLIRSMRRCVSFKCYY